MRYGCFEFYPFKILAMKEGMKWGQFGFYYGLGREMLHVLSCLRGLDVKEEF